MPGPVGVLAVIAVIFAAVLSSTDHDGWAFTASAVAIAATVGSIFIDLYPHVMISSTNAAYDLTVNNSASGHYALVVMTVVAVIFFPLVLDLSGLVVPRLSQSRQAAPPARTLKPRSRRRHPPSDRRRRRPR